MGGRRAGCKLLILRATRGPGRKNSASRGRRRGGRVRASPAHAAAAQRKAHAGEKGRKERATSTRAENARRPRRGQQCRGRAARNQHKPAAVRPPDRMLYNAVLCPPAVRAAARRVRPPATGAGHKRHYMICGRRWAAAAGERARPMASTAKPRAAAGARWPRFQTSPFSVAALSFPGPRPSPSRSARVRFSLYAKYKALAPIAPRALYVFNKTQRVQCAIQIRPGRTRHTGCSRSRQNCPGPHNTRRGHNHRRKR